MRMTIPWFLAILFLPFATPRLEAAELTPEQQKAIADLKARGALVLEVAQTDKRLDIAFHLADQDVTDESLAPLKALDNIYQLNLRNTKITNAGLAHIAELKSLVRLHLEKTSIGDEGLAHLKGLENLEYLNLYGTGVTNAGLTQLAGLKKLKKLYLWETGVNQDGVDQLKQSLPELTVIMGISPVPASTEQKQP